MKSLHYIFDEWVLPLLQLICAFIGILMGMLFILMLIPWFWLFMIVLLVLKG